MSTRICNLHLQTFPEETDPSLMGSKVWNERFWYITVKRHDFVDEDNIFGENSIFFNIILENDDKKITIKSHILHHINENLNLNFIKNNPRVFSMVTWSTGEYEYNRTAYNKHNCTEEKYMCQYLMFVYSIKDKYIRLCDNFHSLDEELTDSDCVALLDQLKNIGK